ncbi:MAG: hypothetical protein ACO2YK_14310 [Paracoccaceae bacterium]
MRDQIKYYGFILLCSVIGFFSVGCSHQAAGLRWSVLPVTPGGTIGPTVGFSTITESTQTTQAEPVKPGAWERKTIGEHIKDTFFDYRGGWETTKTTASQATLLYAALAAGNASGLWKIDEVAFAEDRTDTVADKALGNALVASINRNKQVINADVDNGTIKLIDVPQDRAVSINVRGSNTDFELDFQQDTQADTTISFIDPAE